MARIPASAEGFEFQDGAYWSAYTAGCAVSTTTYHLPGAASWYVIGSGSSTKTFAATYAEYRARIWVYRPAGVGFRVTFRDNAANLLGYIDVSSADGLCRIYSADWGGTYRATGTHVVVADAWKMLEVRFYANAATGVLATQVDGLADASWTGNTGTVALATVVVSVTTVGTGIYVDDMVSEDTNWPGDGRIFAGVPSGVGSSAQFTAVGAANNWQCVDEAPPDGGTTRCEDATPGDKDLHAQTLAASLTGYAVNYVWAEARACNETAAARTIKLGINRLAQHWDAAAQTPGVVYERVVGDEYATDPDAGGAWTNANVAAQEVGYTVAS